MACERFTDGLKAHALGAPLGPEAAAHLAVCSRCQDGLAREQRLHATIEGAMAEIGARAPAPDFTARLRIDLERAPRHASSRWLAPGLATAATIVMVILVVRGINQPPPVVSGRSSPLPSQSPRTAVVIPAAPVPLSATATAARTKRSKPASHPQVEVLVPRQEREAVDRLFASLRAGRPDVVFVLGRLSAGGVLMDRKGMDVAAIRIEPVAIPPMPVSSPVFDR